MGSLSSRVANGSPGCKLSDGSSHGLLLNVLRLESGLVGSCTSHPTARGLGESVLAGYAVFSPQRKAGSKGSGTACWTPQVATGRRGPDWGASVPSIRRCRGSGGGGDPNIATHHLATGMRSGRRRRHRVWTPSRAPVQAWTVWPLHRSAVWSSLLLPGRGRGQPVTAQNGARLSQAQATQCDGQTQQT